MNVLSVRPAEEAWTSPREPAGDSTPKVSPARSSVAAAAGAVTASHYERAVPAGALLRLLRAAALTGGCRCWSDLLHALLMYSLYTAAAVVGTLASVRQGIQQLAGRATIVEAVGSTGCMGVIFTMMWLPLACCFARGRRQFGEVLFSAECILQRVATASASQGPARKHRRQVIHLLIAVIISTAYLAAICFYQLISNGTCGLPKDCAISILSAGLLFLLYMGAHLIPVKFTLVGLEVLCGYRVLISELKDICQGKRQPNDAMLRNLRAIHIDLSETFTSLTDTMSLELISITSYGTLSSVFIWLALIVGVRHGATSLAATAPLVALYLLGFFTAVVLPCELVQQVLNAVSETHMLLLKPQWQLSHLQQELGVYRETASRDLDTLGDLGLFRLQRSTTLSITATIMTYIIVMAQFYVTELTTTHA